MKTYFVYLLASKKNGTLYVGVTSNLEQRVYEHKTKKYKGFTSKYGVDKLVWYESTNDVNEAIYKEKLMKKWPRQYKLNVIEAMNPTWIDLSEGWFDLGSGIKPE